MPSLIVPPVLHHVRPAPTKEALDYAELAIIDFSKIDSPEGRAELAVQVRDALSTQGFFYVINHGYTQPQNDRIFDIADVPFATVSDEEKKAYVANIKATGTYYGYKLREYWHIDGGVRDQLELYNINPDVTRNNHPEAFRPFLPEIDSFLRFNHFNVVHPILRLLALGMELPEDTYPRSDDDEKKSKNVWLKGHTDMGSITVLWSQPIAALQILSRDGQWRWIKHIENALVVNSGDAIEFLSGGFYKATIHRVVQPPQDQRGIARLGVFYFCQANEDVKLIPRAESPIFQKHQIIRRCSDVDAPTMKIWREGRTRGYGTTDLKKREDGNEEELVGGLVVKHYN